jgi:hypothetical protein
MTDTELYYKYCDKCEDRKELCMCEKILKELFKQAVIESNTADELIDKSDNKFKGVVN